MKLYTKKMTYSLIAIGLLAGSPVDAYTRIFSASNCDEMCQGYFVGDANKKKVTGRIREHDITHKLKGALRKRQCICMYTGDLDIEKHKTFNQRDARKSKVQKELRKVRKHADSVKCDDTREICLF